jgi:hypothetical protein
MREAVPPPRPPTEHGATIIAEPRGYQIVDPGLALPEVGLSEDAQVRCLAYLAGVLDDLVPLPARIHVDVIPIEYLAGPYPGLGLYTEDSEIDNDALLRLARAAEERLAEFVQQTGVARLEELTRGESLTWSEILGRF